MLKLVPFNDAWVGNSRIDVHAIYQRPRFKQDEYGEWFREYDAHGLPTWDITSPLPVRSHTKWMMKGFRYVTLASRESLIIAAQHGTLPPGTSPRDFDQHQTGGPWNYRKFREGEQDSNAAEFERLRAMVAQYGADAVEGIRRAEDPDFKLPDSLRAPTAEPAPTKKVAGK